MKNIREYFEELYNSDMNIDDVMDLEQRVYDMEEEEFEQWVKDNNIDLSVVGRNGITVYQYWCWDMCGE